MIKKGIGLRKRGLIASLAFVVSLLSSSLVYAGWSNVTPPSVSNSWELNATHFTSSYEGWAVGADNLNQIGVLIHFSGDAWSNVAAPALNANWWLSGVHLTSSSEGWAVGQVTKSFRVAGVLLHYSGGAWNNETPPTLNGNWSLSGVHFPSSSEGWAVGKIRAPDSTNNIGLLLHYSGGAWSSVTPPSVSGNWYLLGVHFTSPSEGWAVGADEVNHIGILLHYSGGAWSKVSPPAIDANWWLVGTHFTSSGEGWAVGGSNNGAIVAGVLLHYSAGAWSMVTPPAVSKAWGLSGVHFTSSSEGWAVGGDTSVSGDLWGTRGVLLHYSGGGWGKVTPPGVSGDWWLNGVHFPLYAKGWAVGKDGANSRGVLLRYSSPTNNLSGKQQKIPTKNTYTVNTQGDVKFQNSTYELLGTMEVYLDEEGIVSNDEGCYMKFTGDDRSSICIRQIGSASTDVQKSKTDQFLLVGTGEMTIPIGGTPRTGVVYMDLKGTVKKNSSGNTQSVSVTGKIGGAGLDFVSSGSYRMTLTMEEY
jgi:hypothetical protein